MKHSITGSAAIGALIFTIAFATYGADSTNMDRAKNDTSVPQTRNEEMGSSALTPDWHQVRRASKVIGQNVKSPDAKSLGEIKDLVLDPRGRIAYAVLSYGGFMGLGIKLFAVPWSAFTWNSDKHYYVLSVDKETLKRAPGFDKQRWPDMANSKWHEDVYKYYNQKPYWQEGRS